MTVHRPSLSDYPLKDSFPPCLGHDDWDHRVFVCSNETNQENTLTSLARKAIVGNTIAGVSGFCLLNMTAVRGTRSESPAAIENVVIMDRSIRMEHFWKSIQPIIQKSNTRQEVLEKTKQLILKEKSRYFSGGSCAYCQTSTKIAEHYCTLLDQEVQNGISWLSDDLKFVRIKRIFDHSRFHFVLLDIASLERVFGLSQEFKKRGFTIDSLYLSNVEEYINPDEKDAYISSVDYLSSPETLIVQTQQRIDQMTQPVVQEILSRKPPEGNFREKRLKQDTQ
ncbi:MAG: hypothetical protein KGZ39_02970 [Simkania sp.]|nr:hypothetical protein [Simkania sp.]